VLSQNSSKQPSAREYYHACQLN